MKFYQTLEFRNLEMQWKTKLKKNGFDDLEDLKENLYRHDERTQAFENRDRILEFFLTLDSLMSHYPEMPAKERKIMELYSLGKPIKEIMRSTRTCKRSVMYVISRYKHLVLAIMNSKE